MRTTRMRLQSPRDAPQVSGSDAESLNAPSLKTPLIKRENSKPCSHSGSGYNLENKASMSGRVFVLGINGEPLTPCKSSKAKKLLEGKQAVPVWSKFGQFGIQLLVETRKEMPKTVLGIDLGTKFEGYAIACGKENSLSVMWKLPDKKNIVRKLEERRILRKARRHRNCRRRPARFGNRGKKGFIAPSQKVIVQSRLKCMAELFKCYPVSASSLEDVRFNHRDNRWGKNFSTIEIGKNVIKTFLQERGDLFQWTGMDTQNFREQYDYQKSSNKSAEVFNAHCSDALALAVHVHAKKHITLGHFIVVDDSYRPVRRMLHNTQFAKGHKRRPYSSGNFKGVRKGTMCEHGQIVGGSMPKRGCPHYWIRNMENKRIGRTNISWLSHKFRTNGGAQLLCTTI